MSRVSNCPSTTNSVRLASTAAARHAASAPQILRPTHQITRSVASALSAIYKRAANAVGPKTRRHRAVAQYCNGGFSM